MSQGNWVATFRGNIVSSTSRDEMSRKLEKGTLTDEPKGKSPLKNLEVDDNYKIFLKEAEF